MDSSRQGRILKTAKIGHPILMQRAKEVEDPQSIETQQIIADMLATIDDFAPIAGLAAPQVFIPKRIVIFSLPKERARGTATESIPLTVMINPIIEEVLDKEQYLDWEGCLSVPEIWGEVPRYKAIRYHFFTPEGKKVINEATEHHARIIQHECDHLDGILFTQRMKDFSRLACKDELLKYLWQPPK